MMFWKNLHRQLAKLRGLSRHGGSWGFSLLEMTIVVTIVGSLLASGVSSFSTQRENSQRQKTQAYLDNIREALTWYAASNGRLPCPNLNFDGREGDCSALVGVLPWKDLGVSRFDSHNHYFTYHVSDSYRSAITRTTDGEIDVYDGVYDAGAPDQRLLAGDVPAVVVSHGKNGKGRYKPNLNSLQRLTDATATAQELENADDDTIYIHGAGDDTVLWLSPSALKSQLVEAGLITSTTTTTTTTTTTSTTSTTSASTSTSTSTST
ncbi:MAG: type II secretion system protein, partial [Magnetococcales bacterium]|nr:type II secretion system protein [Magnetococcales bacterium]